MAKAATYYWRIKTKGAPHDHPNRAWRNPAAKSDEYLNLTRTVAIPDYHSTTRPRQPGRLRATRYGRRYRTFLHRTHY